MKLQWESRLLGSLKGKLKKPKLIKQLSYIYIFLRGIALEKNLQYRAAAHLLCAISSSVALSAEGESIKGYLSKYQGH